MPNILEVKEIHPNRTKVFRIYRISGGELCRVTASSAHSVSESANDNNDQGSTASTLNQFAHRSQLVVVA